MLRSRFAARARPRHAAIGALALGSTLSVTALALAQAPGAPHPAPSPPAVQDAADPHLAPPAPIVHDARLRFDEPAVVHGRLGAAAAGEQLALQHAPRGRRWRVVARTTVRPDGSYRVVARLRSSGALRVVPLAVRDATGLVAGGEGGAVAAASERPSGTRRVVVAARVVADRGNHDVSAGGSLHVRGTLLPRTRGRLVTVEGGTGGRWRTLAHARTSANGHFDARVVTHVAGTARLRVRFAGDRGNASTRAGAGTLRAFRPSLASWYALYGGGLACGGTLGYDTLGVANKTLPCGTKVTIRYQGREVTVPVIDRGPYVGGREWDLTGATARRLGFSGTGVVWTTR